MPIKSFRDIATSLKGSAFRRVVCDGRTRPVREIRTWGRCGRHPVGGGPGPGRRRSAL